MIDREKELIKIFSNIRDRGWIPTERHGDQCLGNAFEDLLGKKEDNRPKADFYGIELKSHRTITSSLMTLFSKAPSYPRGVNTYLRKTYGVIEEEYDAKILNTTLTGNKENTHRGGHSFRSMVDWKDERIYLQIRDLKTGKIVEDNIYWSFEVIRTALNNKLQKIAILYGDEKNEDGIHYVRYNNMKILSGLTLEKLLHAIEDGYLYIDIRLGVYHSGRNKGKTHDHGTAFRIHVQDLLNNGSFADY